MKRTEDDMPKAPKTGATWTQKALVVILGLAVAGSTMAIATRSDEYAFFDPLIDVRGMLERYYVSEPNNEELQIAAINGMLESLGDPYTVYVPPVEREDFSKELTGEYVGIGAEVGIRDGWLTILSPLDDSPAWNAGIMAEDRVVAIGGESTEGLSVDDSIRLLKGEPKTPVVLTIERGGETLEIEVIRDYIKTLAVKGLHREPGEDGAWSYWIDESARIAYIRLTQFTPGSSGEVAGVLESLGAPEGELNGLVLDLRWNPGGLLDEAVAMADLFMDEGVIVSTRGRSAEERVSRARSGGTLPDFPVAVILNGQSASASEVLAGALQENDRAIVVGTRSFGKGSVQSVRPLPSQPNAVMKITEQGYYLPSGRSIQRYETEPVWGVDPSPGFLVTLDDEELAELIRIRREQEILRSGEVEGDAEARWDDVEWVLSYLKDRQLTTAVRAVQHHRRTGAWDLRDSEIAGMSEATAAELSSAMLARERLLRQLTRINRRIDALETGVDTDVAASRDLWDDDLDVTDGVIEITNAEGDVVATLRITGGDLERWLIDAGVEPITP